MAAPGLDDSDPAAAPLVSSALAVPVELDLDPAEVVGVDGLAGRADDDRALDARDLRARCRPGERDRRAGGDAGEAVLVAAVLAGVELGDAGLLPLVDELDDDELAVEVRAWVVADGEGVAGGEQGTVALAVCAGALGLAFALWELWGW